MEICCIQMAPLLAQPETNLRRCEHLIREACRAKPDVIVLPELWNTGFFPQEQLAACADAGLLPARLGALAREYQVNLVAGSIAAVTKGGVANRCLVFDRHGRQIASYDKTHLFSPMGEDAAFLPGGSLCIFPLDSLRCGVLICYDLRFGELVQALCSRTIDVLFVPAQWPEARIAHLECLCRARAIEHQIYLAVCNGCGCAGQTRFGGRSCIVDPWGRTLAQAQTGEQIIRAACDAAAIAQARAAIPMRRDRRPALYQKESPLAQANEYMKQK